MASSPLEYLRRIFRRGPSAGSNALATEQPAPDQPAVFFKGIESAKRYRVVPNADLGAGRFGIVRHGIIEGTQTSVAIKIQTSEGLKDNSQRKEIDVLRRLTSLRGHPNIIEMVDLARQEAQGQNPREVALVLEMCDSDLLRWMREARTKIPKSVPVRQEICRQLYAGLAFLHQANIVHRDLHQKNVLVHGASGMVKITDFGKSFECTPGGSFIDKFWPIYKRRDILNMTISCVIPTWLNCLRYTPLVPNYRRRFLRRGVSIHLLDQSEYYLVERATKISTRVVAKGTETASSWANEIAKEPGLEATILELHKYALTTPLSADGVPVPSAMHSLLLVGCLVGPIISMNAAWMAATCNGIVSLEDRTRSQNSIREISVGIKPKP